MNFSDDLIHAIQCVSQYIAADIEPDGENDLDLLIAETTLDAGRLEIAGFKDEHEELKKLFNEHGFHEVVEKAKQHVYC